MHTLVERSLDSIVPRALYEAMRRVFLCLLSLAAVSVAVAREASSSPAVSDGRKPNIIFVLADDLGYGDLGCYGQLRIKTPSIDRLASEGLRLTQAYAGGTVCAPSRCVLMTGLHGGHARVRGNTEAIQARASLQSDDVTVASVLKDAGYATGLVGKWGLGESTRNEQGLPRRQGFDYFFGYLKHGHAHNYYPDFLWRNESVVKLPNVISKNPAHKRNVAEEQVQYSHDLFAEEALQFVRDHRDEPFFLYLAFTIPHANNEAGEAGMEVPEHGAYAKLDWPEAQKGHAAMITRMDRDIGRLLQLLAELRLDDNTLVIFASDNGPHREGAMDPDFNDSNGPLRGYKGDLTEGGIRVPMITRWPGRVPAGKTSDSPVYFADVMPTLAALGGGRAPDGIDGVDFSTTLFGNNQPELADRFLYWEWNKGGLRQQAARWRNWKAIRDPHAKSLELHNLDTDIGESRNLAAEHPGIVAKFNDYFRTARTDTPDWPVTVALHGAKSATASTL
jgi:arylsulfatase A-like enzyme